MDNRNDFSLNQQFQLYLSSYLKSKIAFDRAADKCYFLDDNDFLRFSPEEIVQVRESYDKSYKDLQYQTFVFSAFVASWQDHIHFD